MRSCTIHPVRYKDVEALRGELLETHGALRSSLHRITELEGDIRSLYAVLAQVNAPAAEFCREVLGCGVITAMNYSGLSVTELCAGLSRR